MADGDERQLELLGRISTAVVRTMKKNFGKGPERVRAYFLDDMLVVVSKEGVTPAERTLLDAGKQAAVRDFRQLFEDHMKDELTAMIAEMTGREVISYRSQIMFEPDRVVAVYVFDDPLVTGAVADPGQAGSGPE